jgi:hypothetical protein
MSFTRRPIYPHNWQAPDTVYIYIYIQVGEEKYLLRLPPFLGCPALSLVTMPTELPRFLPALTVLGNSRAKS